MISHQNIPVEAFGLGRLTEQAVESSSTFRLTDWSFIFYSHGGGFIPKESYTIEESFYQIEEGFLVFMGKFLVFIGKFLVFIGKFLVFIGKFLDFIGKFLDFIGKFLDFIRMFLDFIGMFLSNRGTRECFDNRAHYCGNIKKKEPDTGPILDLCKILCFRNSVPARHQA